MNNEREFFVKIWLRERDLDTLRNVDVISAEEVMEGGWTRDIAVEDLPRKES